MSQVPQPGAAWDNPMGTDGFEFIEYAAPDPTRWADVRAHGLQGDRAAPPQERDAVPPGRDQLHPERRARFLRAAFARLHGPAICAIAFRVQDAKAAYERAIALGAWGYARTAGPGELNIPAIKGIGDSIIYLVDRWRGKDGAQDGDIGNIGFFDVDFEPLAGARAEPRRQRAHLHRPPDAQRASGPHGRMGRTSTSACSISARSATSTSRARSPA